MTNMAFPPSALKSPVCVVCHDAGAANLIFSWLRAWDETGMLNQFEFKLCLKGPAEKIWQLNSVPLPHMQWHTELTNALADSQTVLTGTGWASSLEHDARRLASVARIPSIAVIDHWVNYTQRFEREGVVVLPDEIWVSAPYALEMAKELFKGITVVELPNTYLHNLVKDIPPVLQDCKNLLYVLEPMRNDWGKGVPGEFQALDFFVKNLEKIVGTEFVRITLRPHPSDAPGKYDAWMQSYANLQIHLDSHVNLNDAIANARWVVGAETFAMVIASASGRATYSSLPPWANRCRLPIGEIIHLQDIV